MNIIKLYCLFKGELFMGKIYSILRDYHEPKLNKYFDVFLIILSLIPSVFLLVIVKYCKFIRIGTLFSNRIGHFVYESHYLNYKKNPNFFDLYWLKDPANKQWEILFKRHFNVLSFVRYLDFWNHILNIGIPSPNPLILGEEINGNYRDDLKFMDLSSPFQFTPEEHQKGEEWILENNFKKKIACVIVRDSAYIPDARYHDYRDSCVNDFRPAIEYLLAAGFSVFRMGKMVSNNLEINHDQFLDYANSKHRCDFLDIWLMKNASLAISTSTGLDHLAKFYHVPVIYINFIPLPLIYTNERSLYSFKVLKKHNREFTLSEYFQYCYFETDEYSLNGITIHPMNSEEILNVVIEYINERKDVDLNKKFWGIYLLNNIQNNENIKAKISNYWLSRRAINYFE
jgi:putative glycosyltransferase (TIGR04372 family)